MKFEFKNLQFNENDDFVDVTFLKYFHFQIQKRSLEKIAVFKIEKNAIIFEGDSDDGKGNSEGNGECNDKDNGEGNSEGNDKILAQQFNAILAQGFADMTGFYDRKAIYVHKNSGIPLIGNLGFGIVDRNTDALEIKPISGCNLDCTFCSVDEGRSSKKTVDFVVESDYLIEEAKKLIEFKEVKTSLHINPHGEPLLYADIVGLVSGLRQIKNAGTIAIYTNGALLNEKLIDELADAGLDRLSISLHSLDEKKAGELAGTNYSVKHVLSMIDYARKKRGLEVILSPVFMPKINESDVEEIVLFGKKHDLPITIQNFLNYRLGRNPAKQVDFDKFFGKLREWEERYDVKLMADNDPKFAINKTKKLPVPFKTGDAISATVVSQGRYLGEMIAAAQERTIVVPDCRISVGERIGLKIAKSKDNIFIGTISKGKQADLRNTRRR